jgi:hypothetical protein
LPGCSDDDDDDDDDSNDESEASKAIPLQTLTGPGDSRRLRLPDFKIIGT